MVPVEAVVGKQCSDDNVLANTYDENLIRIGFTIGYADVDMNSPVATETGNEYWGFRTVEAFMTVTYHIYGRALSTART